MRFSAGIIVLNGMPWLPWLLRSLYPLMDEIVVVEGAVISAAHSATPDGRSLDGTAAALAAFPDPDRKITRIQKKGFWDEKDAMSAAYAEACTGDYLWQVDGDEFYKAADVRWIQNYLRRNPEVGAVSFKTLNFFGGVRAVVKGGYFAYGADQFWRLFKWGRGYRYATHRPPTVLAPNGADLRDGATLTGNQLAHEHGIYLYHYSYVLPAQVQYKTRYHQTLGRYHRIQQHTRWYADHFEHFTPWRVQMQPRPLSWLEPFQGEHPPEIQALLAQDPRLATRPQIARVIDSRWRWRVWQTLGRLDCIAWKAYDQWLRPRLRPWVRPIRARFFGYRYD